MCREQYEAEGTEPFCIEGRCPTGFDELPEEALRLLGIRSMVMLLGEMGLAERVCREYEVEREDLEMLAFIEAEVRELQAGPEK